MISASTTGKASPQAWGLCALLFLATTLNYLDRQTLSILSSSIQREMHLDNEALGWLFSVFYCSYTLSQFAVGPALDRWNLRWAYSLAVLAWSAVAGLTAAAQGFAGLVSFRLLLGIAESANWPAAMRIVARLLPPADRALGNGLFTSGTSVGALIAPGLILGISGWLGWRFAFVGVAALGLLWFAAWVPFSRCPAFAEVWRDPSPPVRARAAYREVLRSPKFWNVFVVTILVNPCLYFNVNWLPVYLTQVRGVEPGQRMGWILTAIYLGLDLGYLAFGIAVRVLATGRAVEQARIPVFAAATVLLGACGLVPHAASLESAVALLILENFGAGMWIAMYLTIAQEVSPANVSTAAGLLGGSGALAGGLAMWAVGKVTGEASGFALPMHAVAMAALGAAAAGYTVSRKRPGKDLRSA